MLAYPSNHPQGGDGALRIGGNTYDLREFAGAFGDLGTLIPFVVGYITVSKMDPVGVLVAFGLFKIFAGLYFKTPVPIQPMKAIGTAAITHAGTITPGAIWASGLFSGVFWLVMGITGTVSLDRQDHQPPNRPGSRARPGPRLHPRGRQDDGGRLPPRGESRRR